MNQVRAVRLLEKRGYSVVVAGNGWAAVEAWETELFHLVLMDIPIPGMEGCEAAAAIREAEKITGKHIPIVVMTAHALKGDQHRCIVASMDGYVSKRTRSMELFALLERLLALIQPPILLFNGLTMFGLLFTVREMIDFAAQGISVCSTLPAMPSLDVLPSSASRQ